MLAFAQPLTFIEQKTAARLLTTTCWWNFSNRPPRHPVLKNYRVRVYRVTLAPGESTPMHTHLFAGLALTLSPARIAIQTKGSKRVQRINVRAGEVRWRPEPVTHSIKNIGKTRFEGVDIELK